MGRYAMFKPQTNEIIVDVDLICEDWNNSFLIHSWVDGNKEKYTFIVVSGRRNPKTLHKILISKKDAFAIIDRLKLICVKDGFFKNAGVFHSESFIKSEIERISKIKQEKESELLIISDLLSQYSKSLKSEQ